MIRLTNGHRAPTNVPIVKIAILDTQKTSSSSLGTSIAVHPEICRPYPCQFNPNHSIQSPQNQQIT